MHFRVRKLNEPTPDLRVGDFFLRENAWDDWFTYKTTYVLFYKAVEYDLVRIGQVKIGQFGMPYGQERPSIDGDFNSLDDRFLRRPSSPSHGNFSNK